MLFINIKIQHVMAEALFEKMDEATIMFLNTFGKKGNVSMDLLSTPLQERQHYNDLLAKGM